VSDKKKTTAAAAAATVVVSELSGNSNLNSFAIFSFISVANKVDCLRGCFVCLSCRFCHF